MIEFPGAPNPARETAAGLAAGRGYLVAPSAGSGPGVLALHAWWGLNDTFKAFCDRLAGAGFTVLAPDLFGGTVVRTIDEAQAQVQAHEDDEAAQIALEQQVLGAADELARRTGTPIGGLGFSFGAAYALWLAKKRPEQVGAVVVYYGTYPGVGGQPPVMGHFAADDPYEPAANVDAFDAELRAAGRVIQFHRYPGTRHWFAEADRPEYDERAAEAAFGRTVAFLHEQLAG